MIFKHIFIHSFKFYLLDSHHKCNTQDGQKIALYLENDGEISRSLARCDSAPLLS
jgi:hypothetical protein